VRYRLQTDRRTTERWVSVKPGLWTGLDWTMDWTGLWTGLDYGLDWTMDWTGLTKTAVHYTIQTVNLSPALPQVAS